jgi:hypothetical protein
MECNNIEEKLSAYIEGLSSSEEKAMIEEHLKSCQACRTSLADLEKTVSYVKSLEDIEPPAWLSRKVMTRVRKEAAPKEGILHKLFYPLHIKLPVQAIATILIAVSAFYIFKTMQPEIMPSKVVVDEMTAPQVLLKDKDVSSKSTKLDERVSPTDEAPEPIITADIPKRDREVDRGTAAPESKIASSLKGNERLSYQLKEEVITDEVSKPMPSEPVEQRFHAKESETTDRYKEVMRSQAPVEKQEALKTTGADVKAKDEEVGGISFKAGKVAGEKEEYADITLTVDSLEAAQKDIEKIVEHLEGKIIETEDFKDRQVLIISYDSSKTNELLEKLQLIGEIEGEAVLEEREGYREISIEIVEK